MDERIPVLLLAGFLGSGKTSLLQRGLRQPGGERVLAVVDESDSTGLDHLLVQQVGGAQCLCCGGGQGLVQALTTARAQFVAAQGPAFDRVVVEVNGLADPAPLLRTLTEAPALLPYFRPAGVLTAVDLVSASASLAEHSVAQRQVAAADHLLLTKGDVASRLARAQVERQLQRLNPTASCLSADQGLVELWPASAAALAQVSAAVAPVAAAEADAGIQTHVFHFSRPLDERELGDWLSVLRALTGPAMLRIKGLLRVQGGPARVLHGVQHILYPLASLPVWPDGDLRSRLVFITRGLGRDAIEAAFRRLAREPLRVAG